MRAGRVRVGMPVARRELSTAHGLAVLSAAAAAVVVAHTVAGGLDAGSSLFDRALRRFDLTLLYLSATMALFRISARIEQDECAGWLDGFLAAGASRVRYAFGIASGAFAASASLFGAGAACYCAAAFVLSGSSELLAALPATLGGGLLLLLHWCVWITLVATLLRRALPAFFVGFFGAIVPFVLLTIQLQRSGSAAAGLVWLVRLLPPLVPTSGLFLAAVNGLAIVGIAMLLRRAATSFIGRHP